MKAIFSDRFAPVGFLAALTLLGILSHATVRAMGSAYAGFDRCAAEPGNEALYGKKVRIHAARPAPAAGTREVPADVIWLEKDGIRLPVAGLPPIREGMRVHLLARFEDGGYFRALSFRVESRYTLKRAAMFGVSIAVAIAVLAMLARRLRRAPAGAFFEERRRA